MFNKKKTKLFTFFPLKMLKKKLFKFTQIQTDGQTFKERQTGKFTEKKLNSKTKRNLMKDK